MTSVLAAIAIGLCSPQVSSDPMVGVKPSIMTLEELATVLSKDGVQVVCNASLASRVALVALRERPFSEQRLRLEKGLGVKFVEYRPGNWTIAVDTKLAAADAALLSAYYRGAEARLMRQLTLVFRDLAGADFAVAQQELERAQEDYRALSGSGSASSGGVAVQEAKDRMDRFASVATVPNWIISKLLGEESSLQSLQKRTSGGSFYPSETLIRRFAFPDRSAIHPKDFSLNWILEARGLALSAWMDLDTGALRGVAMPLTKDGLNRVQSGYDLGPLFDLERGTTPWTLAGQSALQSHESVLAGTRDLLKSDIGQAKVQLPEGTRLGLLQVLQAYAEQYGQDVIAQCPASLAVEPKYARKDTSLKLASMLAPLLRDLDATYFAPQILQLSGLSLDEARAAMHAYQIRKLSISIREDGDLLIVDDELGFLRRTVKPPISAFCRLEDRSIDAETGVAAVSFEDLRRYCLAATPESNAAWFSVGMRDSKSDRINLQQLAESMPFFRVLCSLSTEQLTEALRAVADKRSYVIPCSTLSPQALSTFSAYLRQIPTLNYASSHPIVSQNLRGAEIRIGHGLVNQNPGTLRFAFSLYGEAPRPTSQPLIVADSGVPLRMDEW
ncbi:MAG: hypothetical protein KF784_00320 [Fimbriimonadaceae bacterium]|nr:hypothetical protein [Fimbriimonadaceae bacterium]